VNVVARFEGAYHAFTTVGGMGEKPEHLLNLDPIPVVGFNRSG